MINMNDVTEFSRREAYEDFREQGLEERARFSELRPLPERDRQDIDRWINDELAKEAAFEAAVQAELDMAHEEFLIREGRDPIYHEYIRLQREAAHRVRQREGES